MRSVSRQGRMALVSTDCRRWQGHDPLLIVRLFALSQSSSPFVAKRRVSCIGRWRGRIVPDKRVRTIGRVQRTNFRSNKSELRSGRPVTRSFPGLSGKVVNGAELTDNDDRPPFDLDVAVLLAGFAFESYNTPAENVGVLETDGRDCETTYLSKEYMKSIYDGQLFVSLKKGVHFPGLDLWGTSDPYVVFRIGDCSARSRTIWANKDPVWNETLTLNVKTSAGHNLQVAAWDANIITLPRRMGNTSVPLDNLCDGEQHQLELDLEGMGGGGGVLLEVQFKSFAQIEAEQNQFSFAGIFGGELLANAYKTVFGEGGIGVGDFIEYLRPMLERGVDLSKSECVSLEISNTSGIEEIREGAVSVPELDGEGISPQSVVVREGSSDEPTDMKEAGNKDEDEEVEIWRSLSESFSQTLKPFGIDISEVLKDEENGEVSESVKSLGFASQKRAELLYAESGLAIIEDETEESQTSSVTETNDCVSVEELDPLPAGKEVLEGLVNQTEGIVGAWAIFNKCQGEGQEQCTPDESGTVVTTTTILTVDEKANAGEQGDLETEIEGIKTTMFSTAESAMEAWALLSKTFRGTSFVKSDFEKICFVENKETDTQLSLWRDSRRQRLVVAFRGTEQTKWKDLVTDLNLLASSFNPERVTGGSNPKDEPLVHSGFLKAYDSVKTRILSHVRASIDSSIIEADYNHWHIYVTGHSLGGALATLFALELASSKLAKNQNVHVTMYNYGSPRVGNQVFAYNYNKIVQDSWRVVNHRDIVPTVPRLMGYCHVAQPIYLFAEKSPMSNLSDDGYNGDVIGEATPDVLFDKFMRGEQAMLRKLLDTEISMLRAMRDGSAVMQHMEDFYYITLLQRVESRMR